MGAKNCVYMRVLTQIRLICGPEPIVGCVSRGYNTSWEQVILFIELEITARVTASSLVVV